MPTPTWHRLSDKNFKANIFLCRFIQRLYACVIVAQLHLILYDPMDCSLPGSSVPGILQARILQWVVIPFARGSSQLRYQSWVSCIAGRFFFCNHLSHQGIKYTLSEWKKRNSHEIKAIQIKYLKLKITIWLNARIKRTMERDVKLRDKSIENTWPKIREEKPQ